MKNSCFSGEKGNSIRAVTAWKILGDPFEEPSNDLVNCTGRCTSSFELVTAAVVGGPAQFFSFFPVKTHPAGASRVISCRRRSPWAGG